MTIQKDNTICPVSVERLNENVARIVAFFVILLTLISINQHNVYVSLFLIFDFLARALSFHPFSLLRQLALFTSHVIGVSKKPVDAAPKKFAAGIGAFFCLGIVIAQLADALLVEFVTGSILIACAALEGFLGYCIGCTVYTFSVKIRLTSKA